MNNSRINNDADFCSTIPLHNTNAIQPHGALLIVNATDFRVIQISSNVCEWLGLLPEALLNQPLAEIIQDSCVDKIREQQDRSLLKIPVPEYLTFKFGKRHQTYLAQIHEKEGYILIEIEFINQNSQETKPFVNGYQQLQQVSGAINESSSIGELAAIACREIRRISGFDKVMIYTFDANWNGLVIGEEMEKDMESYIGLKFPASDIPRQARDLYLKNSYRFIPDRKYKSVPLIPEINPLTNGPTDLSDIKTRSVVDVHLEYLANMNVQASMSTRIIHNESLWGLIACHHREPKLLSFDECAVFELMSNVISSKLSSLVNQSRTDERMRLNNLRNEITGGIIHFDNVVNGFKKYGNELINLLGGNGAAICWDGKLFTVGVAPQKHQMEDLLAWLQKRDLNAVVAIHNLPDVFPPAREYADVAAGLLILPIQPYEGNFILAFRMEVVKTVSWGGNPDDVVTFHEGSTRYHPRNSFAVWKETVRHTSEPWSDEELISAERFRNVVVENTLKKLTATLEEKVKKRTRELARSKEKLSLTLEELQELAHVTSHDLQEPVRKIHLFASELNKPLGLDKRKDYIEKIMRASSQIRSLIADLINVSDVRGDWAFRKSDLQVIVDGVLKKLEPLIIETNVNVIVNNLPTVEAVPEQMDQLFTTIIDNAIKFRRRDVQARIELKGDFIPIPDIDGVKDQSRTFARISISDNGIGFNENYADKLFKIFETLHPGKFEGTGSSLAVAKRIVESHGGKISARGKENEGSVFTVILPVSQVRSD